MTVSNNFWWFGVNNKKKRPIKSNPHVIYPEISSFLNGEEKFFEWPYGGTRVSNPFYEQMRPNDKVIIWMGDGDFKNWGIVGFAYIKEIKYGSNISQNRYILQLITNEITILTPYSGKPAETEETLFLRNIFGVKFWPLRKTFHALGYAGVDNYVITIDKVEPEQFKAVYDRLVHSKHPEAKKIIKNGLESLIPNEEIRKCCLSVFLEAIREAHWYGENKWGVYFSTDEERLRLVMGRMIIMTINQQGVWLALKEPELAEDKDEFRLLNEFKDWQWDTGHWSVYKRIPSKNGFYLPSKNHSQVWPYIRGFHFDYIEKVAKGFSQLSEDSQSKHMPEVLSYLRHELKQYVPEPDYRSPASSKRFLHYIREFQFTQADRHLTKTEREAIVQSRIGQGQFRDDLIRYWRGCAVTQCQIVEILRASHIKPWRVSNNDERMDFYNGLLLVPNLDAAFDRGLISFSDDGQILISDILSAAERDKLSIRTDMHMLHVGVRHRWYLEYHRQFVFKP